MLNLNAKLPWPPNRLAHAMRLAMWLMLATFIGCGNGNAQPKESDGLHWNNSGFTIRSNANSEQKSIKLGRALSFNRSNIGQNLIHSMQFIVSPGQAAQRERMNLYSLEELGKSWPEIRKVLSDTDVKATLVTPSQPNKYVGVPVKWNSAFATTMSGAFWGAEAEPMSDLPTAVASALIADGIVSGQRLSINEASANTKVSITGSEPKDIWRGINISMKNSSIDVPKKSAPNRTAFVGFSIKLDEAFSEYRENNPEFTAQAPTAITQIISTRELDGSRLTGCHDWITE